MNTLIPFPGNPLSCLEVVKTREESGSEALICGKTRLPGKPYCEEHAAKNYMPNTHKKMVGR